MVRKERLFSAPFMLCSTPVPSTLDCRDVFDGSAPARETQSPLVKETVYGPSQRATDFYRKKSLLLVSDESILMRMRSVNSHTVWSKKRCSDWSERSLSDWSVKVLMI